MPAGTRRTDNVDVRALRIRRVIFHDIPKKIRDVDTITPQLAQEQTEANARVQEHLKRRLVEAVLGPKHFPVRFAPGTTSPIPGLIHAYTTAPAKRSFIEGSQLAANHLFAMQTGSASAGILCVIDCVVEQRNALAIMKLEREEGSQLEMQVIDGKRQFSLSVLDNLILTEGTKFFKCAIFVRTGTDADAFFALTCDNQRPTSHEHELSQYFLGRFLGCALAEEPRTLNKRFFGLTLEFINDQIPDPVLRDRAFTHLNSYMTSQQPRIVTREFANQFLPTDLRQQYLTYLHDSGLTIGAFPKETSQIASQLERKSIHMREGVTVSAPADRADELIQITEAGEGKARVEIVDIITRIDGKRS